MLKAFWFKSNVIVYFAKALDVLDAGLLSTVDHWRTPILMMVIALTMEKYYYLITDP